MPIANPTTTRERIRASVLATLDASELDASTNSWPASLTTGVNVDPTYPRDWVDWLIDTSAAEIAEVILLTEDHPSRSDFLTLTGPYSWANRLTSYKGRAGDVIVYRLGLTDPNPVLGLERSYAGVKWRRDHYTRVGSYGDEYYFITESNQLFFSGPPLTAVAKVYLGDYNINWAAPTADPLASFPTSFLWALEAAALARAFAQKGHKLDAARTFRQEWEQAKAIIMRGEIPQKPNPYVKESA